MPPYVIAHNKDLVALASIRPSSADALASVPGFGPSRVAKYGDEILALIASAADD
jgi:ATP-dependent DNA helicase RecQ